MKTYTNATISEQTLEDLIRQNAGMIEEGLVYLDHQKQTAGGRLDMLFVDSGNALVVAELKVTQDDNTLMQAVDYYDYVTSHLETYVRLYAKHEISLKQQVRLILVAPNFSQALVNRVKWLNIPIALFTYRCIQLQGDADVIPIFSERETEFLTPSQTEPNAGIYTLEDHLDYATDPIVRERIIRIIEETKSWSTIGHITMDPIKESLSFKVNGRWFSYLHVRRKHFLVGMYDDDETYKEFPVKSQDDYEGVIQKMKAAAQRAVSMSVTRA